MKRLMLIYAAIFIILIGLALVVFNYTPSEGGSAGDATNSLALGDTPYGNGVVTVDSAKLERAGFVVIHEANGSDLGMAVAVSPLLAGGENKLIFVPANLQQDKSYFAVLRGDNGDGTFNIDNDELLKTSRGKEVRVKFSVK